MKRFLLFFIFCCAALLAPAQTLLQQAADSLGRRNASAALSDGQYLMPWTPTDAAVPPSPEAAWRNRYTDYPVSHATGTVQVDIPLCQLPVKDIPFHVSLSYHTAGVRVDDVAGVAGLGWTLRAGGSISRVVNGQPDEQASFSQRTHSSVERSGDLDYLEDLLHYEADANLDRYYYEFDGQSGSFVCHPNTGVITQLPPTSNAIERIENADGTFDFSIRTLSGATYYFTEREHSSYQFRPTVVSAAYHSPDYANAPTCWHLARVVSPFGRDEVTLTYDQAPAWQRMTQDDCGSLFLETSNTNEETHSSSDSGSRLSATSTTFFNDQRVLKRISSDRFGSIEFTHASISGGASTGQPDIRLSRIDLKDCAGRTVRTITLDNNDKGLGGKLRLKGLTVSEGGKTVDKRTFQYYSEGTTGYSRPSKDFFGYCNEGLSNLRSESILLTDGTVGNNRRHYLPGTQRYALKSIAEATGAVTTYTYESNLCDTFDEPVAIGLRVKQIEVSDPVRNKKRTQTFTYEQPHCTVDFSQLGLNAFVSLSGCRRTTLQGYKYYSSAATLTSSCRIPGFRAENAVVYYGKVTEDVTSTTDTDCLRTVYEYDTSDCEHPFHGMAGGQKPSVTTEPERYLGEKINMTTVSSSVALQYQTMLSPKTAGGYFLETAWEKAPLVKKTVYRHTASGYEPSLTEEHAYKKVQQGSLQSGFHVEPLVRTVEQNGLEQEDYRSVADLHYFETTLQYARRLKTGTQTTRHYADGSSRTVHLAYEYDAPPALTPLPAGNIGPNAASIPLPLSGLPGFEDLDTRRGNTYLPVAETLSCGTDTLFHYLCYAANLPQAPYTSLATAGARSLPALERWKSRGKTVTLTSSYQDFGGGKYSLSAQALSDGSTEIARQDYPKYDAYGNLLETSVNQGPPASYAYGYKHTLPVAVVQGEGYADLGAVVEHTLGTYAGGTSISSLFSQVLGDLQERAGSLTTLYAHSPLTGITKVTAPNGGATTYTYTGNLLTVVTDCDNRKLASFDYALRAEGGSENRLTARTYLDGNRSMENKQLFDGLGLPYQLLRVGVTPSGQTLASQQDYDSQYREVKTWLPVATASTGALANFASASSAYHGDARAYTQRTYEASEGGEQTALQQPGADLAGKAVRTDRLANSTTAALQCRRYEASGTGVLKSSGLYAAGTLEVAKTTDEDGKASYVFTDYLGRTLLERRMDGTTAHDTYYVYDEWDHLCFVLPPEASARLSGTTWNIATDATLRAYAYYYRYDSKFRCVEQKLPGADAVYHVYDRTGALVFSQDGNQRQRGVWGVRLSDRMGRPALTGEYTGTSAPDIANAVVRCTYSTASAGLSNSHYVVEGVSLGNFQLLQANYYDRYDFLSQSGFTDRTTFPTGTVNAKGLQTGSILATLEGGTFLYEAYYYDLKGRVTKQVRTNLLGGADVTTTAYTLTDKPSSVTHTHTANGKTTRTETYGYTYDQADRLTKTTHSLGGTQATLASYAYDDLGRLQTKNLHGNAGNQQTYAYNLRSWLTGIGGSKFAQNLYYTTGNGTKQYNGNLSSLTWKAGNETTTRGYKFSYDGLDRLTTATYGEGTSIATNADRFTEKVTGYDKNGNILGLQRYGQTSASAYGLVDNLTFTLSGNQLTRVDDAATASAYNGGFEFKDAVKQANEYAYDPNGNLNKDLNKNITSIQYNCLNLPCKVSFGDGSAITYTYSADGTKLRAVYVINGSTTTTDYCGNVVYENGAQKWLLTDEGYVSLSDNQYHYYLKDHQGNNRVVINSAGTVEETNHYYPFGGTFVSSASVQPYKYNGKEYDAKKGLNWYDYGARWYDAGTGRWHMVDPMADRNVGTSPYVYCFSNPIRFIDPNGQDGWDVIVGYGIGFLTNVIPGTGHLRDAYTPTDAVDYNNALRAVDNTSLVVGGGMIAVGGGAMLAGESATVVGTATAIGSGGAAAPVAIPVAGGGIVLTEAGVATVGMGVMMMGNAKQNQQDGYDRGKKSNVSSGNKNSQHANQKAKEAADQKYQEAKAKYNEYRTKANKTPEEKIEEKRWERLMDHWKKKADFVGENHSRNHKGSR